MAVSTAQYFVVDNESIDWRVRTRSLLRGRVLELPPIVLVIVGEDDGMTLGFLGKSFLLPLNDDL